MYGTASTKDDPVFGNRKGHTVLFVTIDHHINGAHNALQLNLDRSLVKTLGNETYHILHDGRMTVNKGALKKQEVLDFMAQNDHMLFSDEKIDLGCLPSNRSISWSDAEEFILRLFLYATLREKLRFKLAPKKNMSKSKRQVFKKL